MLIDCMDSTWLAAVKHCRMYRCFIPRGVASMLCTTASPTAAAITSLSALCKQHWTCDGSANQRWLRAADGTLRPLHALQSCLDVTDVRPGAKLQVSFRFYSGPSCDSCISHASSSLNMRAYPHAGAIGPEAALQLSCSSTLQRVRHVMRGTACSIKRHVERVSACFSILDSCPCR